MTKELEIGDQITVRGTVADYTSPCVKVRFEGGHNEPLWMPRKNIATNEGQPIKVGDTVSSIQAYNQGNRWTVLAIDDDKAWVKSATGDRMTCDLAILRRA